MDHLLVIPFVVLTSLCWGSFLNSLSYRIVYEKAIFTYRSYCFQCKNLIFWYDNIPVLSWLLLGGRCRNCKNTISWIYPFMEMAAAFVFTLLFVQTFRFPYISTFVSSQLLFSFFAYVLFFSALLIAAATDLIAMVIPQLVTVYLIPIGIICALFNVLHISIVQSILGALFGYLLLWVIAFFFKKQSGKDGLGLGDIELLGMVGSFVGIIGVWTTLLIGSVFGLIVGGSYIFFSGKGRNTQIPFGPFLSFGAIVYVLFQEPLVNLFFF